MTHILVVAGEPITQGALGKTLTQLGGSEVMAQAWPSDVERLCAAGGEG